MNDIFEKAIKINDIVKTNNIITGISYEIIMCFISNKTHTFHNSNDYQPMLKDNLYFSKDCSVPRFKLKGFCQKHQVKITTNSDKANIVFISEKFIDEYTDSDWGSTTNYTDFITFANLVFPNNKAILTFINQTSNLNITNIKFNSYRIKNSFANLKNIDISDGKPHWIREEFFTIVNEFDEFGNCYLYNVNKREFVEKYSYRDIIMYGKIVDLENGNVGFKITKVDKQITLSNIWDDHPFITMFVIMFTLFLIYGLLVRYGYITQEEE